MKRKYFTIILLLLYGFGVKSQTIALWPFDEQEGLYPSCVLSDFSDNDYPLVIGNGGVIIKGKFGNALLPQLRPKVNIPEGKALFGLEQLKPEAGRTTPPLSWSNADFCALMTRGEKNLRNQVGFPHVTQTKLNLGDFDWTVEFWFRLARKTNQDGVVFEIGQGPRGENDHITSLLLKADCKSFLIVNQPSGLKLEIATSIKDKEWHHLAFVYNSQSKQLTHYVDGKVQPLPEKAVLRSLPEGDEDYMSIGRDGMWEHPLQGAIDELRFSEGQIFTTGFKVPGSYSYLTDIASGKQNLKKGPKLLFDKKSESPVNLGDRKYLFIDDAILDKYDPELEFVVNPPEIQKIVMNKMTGAFRKHLNVLEDEKGRIRLYTTVDNDYLAVWFSDDGDNFYAPKLPNGNYKEHTNIVLHSKVGMGMVFIDPNAPKKERYKYISDYNRRAVCLFYSEDGLNFKRYKQPVLPFRSGSQCNIYYDDQKQEYIAFHRSDFGRTKSGATERDFVMTETKDILHPWDFQPLTQDDYKERTKGKRVYELQPWYLDNGPLTPGGFSMEYPWVFSPIDSLDPSETDIYVSKAMKYPWAPDTYLAFPIVYFHYEESLPVTRLILADEKMNRGSGTLETQVSVSRNGTNWQRFPRPAYVGIGNYKGVDFKTAYLAHGMIKRGNEIWQYCFCEPHYHSPYWKDLENRSVLKLKQRLDGFVSLDSPYGKEVYAETKPFTFKGNKLHINVDTEATGYVQVGFIDENGNDIPGFSVDDCIYINGDFVDTEAEWMKNRQEMMDIGTNKEEVSRKFTDTIIKDKDVSALQGKTVKLVFRMRGARLYAFQFNN